MSRYRGMYPGETFEEYLEATMPRDTNREIGSDLLSNEEIKYQLSKGFVR